MKKLTSIIFAAILLAMTACASGNGDTNSSAGQAGQSGETMNITVTIGAKTFGATLSANETARAFAAKFPLTLDMSELNGNEYYKYLDGLLPANAANPRTITAGDIKLYGANCVVIFYKSFSTSYRYTTLGNISDSTGLEGALKASGGKVTFALAE